MSGEDKASIRTTVQSLDLPPITKRRLGRRRKKPDRPVTQAELDAIRFVAIKSDFDWSNEDWAKTWLPWIRLSLAILHLEDEQRRNSSLEAVRAGVMPQLLEGLVRAKEHLGGVHNAVEAAFHRCLLDTERLGYTRENPPPKTPISVQ
jgi:hypothetical protein